jgi:hypothetical protein
MVVGTSVDLITAYFSAGTSWQLKRGIIEVKKTIFISEKPRDFPRFWTFSSPARFTFNYRCLGNKRTSPKIIKDGLNFTPSLERGGLGNGRRATRRPVGTYCPAAAPA